MTKSPIKPAEYLKRARELEASWPDNTARLGVVSTFTAELLRPFLIVESERLSCPLRPWFAPFGQLEQSILDDNSTLWQQDPDVLWIAVRLDDVERYLDHQDAAIGVAATEHRLAAIRERTVTLARGARKEPRGNPGLEFFCSRWAVGQLV